MKNGKQTLKDLDLVAEEATWGVGSSVDQHNDDFLKAIKMDNEH